MIGGRKYKQEAGDGIGSITAIALGWLALGLALEDNVEYRSAFCVVFE